MLKFIIVHFRVLVSEQELTLLQEVEGLLLMQIVQLQQLHTLILKKKMLNEMSY